MLMQLGRAHDEWLNHGGRSSAVSVVATFKEAISGPWSTYDEELKGWDEQRLQTHLEQWKIHMDGPDGWGETCPLFDCALEMVVWTIVFYLPDLRYEVLTHIACRFQHPTRHMSHLPHATYHAPRHSQHTTRHTSLVAFRTTRVTCRTSHVRRTTYHATRRTPHANPTSTFVSNPHHH